MTSQRVFSFEPVIDERSTRIILGTLPSEKSLVKGEYYGNPQNDFWRLTGGAFGSDLSDLEYSRKKEILIGRGIALWDVVREGTREGSKDDTICPVSYNDINRLLSEFNNIKYILLNGKLSCQIFEKKIRPFLDLDIVHHCLPSSSPANRRNMRERALEWKEWLTRP